MCQCDVNSSNTITALDGFHVVRKAVGLITALSCPAPTTTTSLAEASTSTSLAETSTTTTTTL
jgi:hypothetical protein